MSFITRAKVTDRQTNGCTPSAQWMSGWANIFHANSANGNEGPCHVLAGQGYTNLSDCKACPSACPSLAEMRTELCPRTSSGYFLRISATNCL